MPAGRDANARFYGNSLQIGDIAGGNFTEIEMDGSVKLHGTATVSGDTVDTIPDVTDSNNYVRTKDAWVATDNLADAPDDKNYLRTAGDWVESEVFTDVTDSNNYYRTNGAWVAVPETVKLPRNNTPASEDCNANTTGQMVYTENLTEGKTSIFACVKTVGEKYLFTPSAPVPGEEGVAGYQDLENLGNEGAIVGETVPGFTDGDYGVSAVIDGVTISTTVTLAVTDDWATVLAALQAAIRTETSESDLVAIESGAIRGASGTTGETSSFVWGTYSGTETDIFTAASLIGVTYAWTAVLTQSWS